MIYLAIIIFILLILLIAISFMILMLWAALFTKVPFVSVDKKILPAIVEAMQINKESVVYDLGCGDGRVLIECYKSNPSAHYIGLDKDWLPIILAKWQTRKKQNIKILKQDFFKQDLTNATHIYLYLFPKMMNTLLPKFEKELQPGTRLITCDYDFAKKEPIQIINIDRKDTKRYAKLLIYKF